MCYYFVIPAILNEILPAIGRSEIDFSLNIIPNYYVTSSP